MSFIHQALSAWTGWVGQWGRRMLQEAGPGARGALAAVAAASVISVATAASVAHLGLGVAGDAAAALLLMAVRTIGIAVPALVAARLTRWHRLATWSLPVALGLAATSTIHLLLPAPYTILYVAALLTLVAWAGAALARLRAALDGTPKRRRRRAIQAATALTALAAAAAWLGSDGPGAASTHARTSMAGVPADAPGESLPRKAATPSAWRVRHFTYGSATPQRRELYASLTDLVTRTVDLSSELGAFRGWQAKVHARYWGFPLAQAPLNGHVWHPDGPGPFPVVVLVHGLHSTGSPSEEGFGYLAESLAGRGYVVMSVDQNFLNGPWIAVREREMAARVKLLAHHLELLREWNAAPRSPLHGLLDLDRIALAGHSRGGEAAAALAASWDGSSDMAPSAVIALAPTDQLLPPASSYQERTFSYLVLQGAQDADVAVFVGTSRFQRLPLPQGSGHFKAAVYVAGANHVHFNSLWGSDDVRSPLAWLLNRRAVMPAAEQQRLTSVLATAFLEAALRGDDSSRSVFRGARMAADLLQPHRTVVRFQDDQLRLVDTFDEDDHPGTTTAPGGTHVARHLDVWQEEPLVFRDRWATPQGNTALYLEWQARSNETPVYEIHMPDHVVADAATPAAHLVFAIASISANDDVDLTVELVSTSGAVAALPLSEFGNVAAAITDPLWKSQLLQRFMIRGPERVLQSIEIPLARFEAVNPGFEAEELDIVRLRFDRVPAGGVIVDDIGLRAADPGRS